MRNRIDVLAWAIAAVGAGLLSGAAVTTGAAAVRPVVGTCTAEAGLAEGKASCCFTNPSYSGTCQVKRAQDETCASILAYLNTPLTTGKSYCSNTEIRGGWQQVACEKEKASRLATAAAGPPGP